ncbi:HK97 family phage prohead protease [Hungatella sp. L12]|uniref:HK97 family phage prohead protease n=2 Tax=Hungatella hominis TaxID=2763050 RepID=A0ABR7HGU3_9FIRM|nr:HK97 family phage prohead protease [Hungatella hominis]
MVSMRAVDGEERTIELSFSSEEPYERWWGVEILDHTEGCIDLERLNSIGCVLFNHNRDVVIAKIEKAWVENLRGYARIKFDEDEASDIIYKKVQNGTLKGVSTGYQVTNWEEVAANKKSEDERFTGPCDIAKRWMPFEISVVSVPADATVGVGRELGDTFRNETGRTLDYFSRQLQINKNKFFKEEII